MAKVFHVARREFLATIRTKAFLLSVVMMPLLITGGIYGSAWADTRSRREQEPLRRIAIVDQTGRLAVALSLGAEAANRERPNQPIALLPAPDADPAALRARINAGELYGAITIDADAVDGAGGYELMRRDSQLETGRRLGALVQEAVVAVRLADAGLDAQRLAELRRPVPNRAVDVTTGQAVRTNEIAALLTPFAFMFLLFMGTFGISQGLLTSLIEEKGSRVIEVLLSAVSPTQLLAGKILGLALVGFLLLGVWGSVGALAARTYSAPDLITPFRVVMAVLYFVPGFLLIASLLAAIGSACNELKDAQSMVFPLSLLTIIPMIFWMYISQHPAAPLSIVLSYVPPITPFIMIARLCADPQTAPWQIASTLALLWVSVFVTMWAAGKIFRVGVLMYGKAPTPREMLRWVRYA